MRVGRVLVALLLALTACASQDGDVGSGAVEVPSETQDGTTSSTTTAPVGVQPLEDGPVTPGRYRFAVTSTCASQKGCPGDEEPALPAVDVTVPEGWDAATMFLSLFPSEGEDTVSRGRPALVMGWSNFWAGLNSQPCSSTSHRKPDIEVGPSVDDFVGALEAHPLLDVTEPEPVRLGRYDGQFLSLFGPADISGCEEWRPWDPNPYLQGPENRWDLWVMDVGGVRVVIMAEYFPETPRDVKAELHAMAGSIRFTPART